MTAYALAQLQPAAPHPDIAEYLERIQATLDPFGGRFLVHGAPVEVREGTWQGQLVMLGFPTVEDARAWYDSPAYQEIVPLRADHIDGAILIVDGVGPDHVSAAMGRAMRAEMAQPSRG